MINLENRRIIKFYRANQKEHGFLSNLYKKPFIFEEREFPTAEHAYQHGKFKEEKTREWAMNAPKPHLLAILAHGLFSWDITPNWSKNKVDRMLKVLRVKFSDPDLKYKLLDTSSAILIEDSKTDAFWGCGKSGKGKNTLGKLLMQVRKELQDKLWANNDHCPKCYKFIPESDRIKYRACENGFSYCSDRCAEEDLEEEGW